MAWCFDADGGLVNLARFDRVETRPAEEGGAEVWATRSLSLTESQSRCLAACANPLDAVVYLDDLGSALEALDLQRAVPLEEWVKRSE